MHLLIIALELSARPTFLSPEEAVYGEGGEGEGEGGLAAQWDVRVGELGSAGLCGAAAALALTPRLLARVAPPQAFGPAGYTGAFRFRFWVFGTWREVAVDDRLPCRACAGAGRAPRLLASAARAHDYLLPLLEKAYAKLYGSYAAMRAGGEEGGARALQELSGGVVQSFSLARQPRALTLAVLHSAAPRCTLLVAGGRGQGRAAAYCVQGLARAHGAALVRVRAVGGGGGAPPRRSAPPPLQRDLLDALHPDEFW
ncbi:hypothetical protein MSG28_012915 [Choristoneura fumiferana]|uniref:Uncharacterized protein n=1 Tax=Choristoneura fumiferana TaxID=7141 RepID=A0ACC0KRX3_CHOFU|nr:hypothetical protein MSG28_012915 [Choristoneura fumiferana]